MAIAFITKNSLAGIFLALAATSCGIVGRTPKYRISDGVYTHKDNGASQKVYVEGNNDSIVMRTVKDNRIVPFSRKQDLSRTSLDVDLLIAPFKYRPISNGFPRQLNTSFNGNVYIGYRLDHFRVESRNTAIGKRRKTIHTAVTFGGFGGIGATPVNPWTTNYRITDEYDGFILSRGIAALVGFNSVTGGFALGFDYLTDRDKKIWIYQNKPWIGIVIGLHLN